MALTDTPIYDQIRQELEAAGTQADRPSTRKSRAAADEGGQAVSVWSLVNQHRSGNRR